MNILLDLILIGILLLCTWNGYRKGLILGISGILALVIAFYGANLIAETYSAEFTDMFHPFVSGLVDSGIDSAQDDYDARPNKSPNDDQVYEVSFATLNQLGFLKSAAHNIALELSESVQEAGHVLKTAMINKLSSIITYVLSLIIVFLLILIVFTIIANIINLAFKLPGLEFINDIAGSALGFIKGLVFLFAIAWALRFFGFFIPEAVIDKSLLLPWLMDNNPIIAVFGI